MLTPSDRVKLITQISSLLGSENWSVIDLTMKQFSLPTSQAWGSDDRASYIMQMISEASDDVLLSLAAHVGIETSPRTSVIEPGFWLPGAQFNRKAPEVGAAHGGP